MLTNENYFSKENQLKYMGASQFKTFMECEERALAEINGDYEREKTTSLLVGSYVDAHFQKTLDLFKAKNPEIFTQKGTLKSEYKKAEYIIERLERDDFFMSYMAGEKQVIKTGEIEGVPFKIKIDVYHQGNNLGDLNAIIDLKIMKDFAGIWKDGLKLNFIEAWGYDIQGAIYREVDGNNLPFYIAGATKTSEPDLAIISIPPERLDYCLGIVKENVKRFADLKKGIGTPTRCGVCDWCLRTKKLTRVISYEELEV